MSDDKIDLPADLHPLRRAYDQAEAELAVFVSRVEAEYRERHPDPTRIVQTDEGPVAVPVWDVDQAGLRNAWTDEENATLKRLRDAAEAARRALWAHPVHAAGRESGDWKKWPKLDTEI